MIELAFLQRITGRVAGLAGLAAALILAPAPASARADIAPYLEVQQVLSADINGGDVLTYTAAVAGINGRVSTQRLEAQISYRYERRFDWNDDLADNDVHNGVAQARLQVVPNLLSLDAGALAARSRADGRGPIFGFGSVDNSNVAEVYSAYAGPTLSTRVGDVDVGASYRLGYVHVDDHSLAGVPRPPGQPVPDRYDSSITHNASASVGMAPGRLPFGWTIGAGYVREEVDRLDREFEGKYVRGDVVVPVSPTLALTAGVGYEDIQSTQQDILRDANGVPIISPDGELVPDPSRPRLLAYDQEGLIWDAGVIWRPSRRTELQARVGYRYGGTTVTGSFRHEINSRFGIYANVFDTVSTFGQLTINNLSGLPNDFNVNPNPLNPGVGGIGGCVFGAEPGSATCFDDAFQSIDTSDFRIRGANVGLSGERGPWSVGLGAGYSQRKYVSPGVTPEGFTLDGRRDHSFTVHGYLGRELSHTSGVNVDAYAAWFDSGVPGAENSFGAGVSGSYYRTLWFDHLQGYAAAGLYTSDSGEFDETVASGLIGLRYTF